MAFHKDINVLCFIFVLIISSRTYSTPPFLNRQQQQQLQEECSRQFCCEWLSVSAEVVTLLTHIFSDIERLLEVRKYYRSLEFRPLTDRRKGQQTLQLPSKEAE